MTDRRATHNSTFAIGGITCTAAIFVVAESIVRRINISGKNPAHRKSVNLYQSCYGDSATFKLIDYKLKTRPIF